MAEGGFGVNGGLVFFVAGEPVPQGSHVAVVSKSTGRAFVKSANERSLAYWRGRIATEAQAAMAGAPLVEGPLAIDAQFYLTRPESRPKRERWPDRRPDLDKLTRSVLDALKRVAYRDDKQICAAHVSKCYATAGPPGVMVMLYALSSADESPASSFETRYEDTRGAPGPGAA